MVLNVLCLWVPDVTKGVPKLVIPLVGLVAHDVALVEHRVTSVEEHPIRVLRVPEENVWLREAPVVALCQHVWVPLQNCAISIRNVD